MGNMKSLADQIRQELVKPATKTQETSKKNNQANDSAILQMLIAYDNSRNKNMVHVRLEAKTVKTLNQLKMAANVDLTKVVAFAVTHLFDTYPELKIIIKQYLTNEEL